MSCPGSNTVQALVDGALDAREREAFLTHAADCPQCRMLVGTLLASERTTDEHQTEAYPDPPSAELAAGTQVGRFVIDGRLGAGAMGVVYAAHDPELDRRVAIKLLRADPLDEEESARRRTRMQREAQALARVSHANVMTVFDVGTHAGQVFIAMELVEGWTVRGWLAAEPRDWRAVVDVYLAAARGLAAAHAVGVVHRDFKPDNVLVGRDGRVLVTDFGLARRVGAPAEVSGEEAVTITRTGAVMGTPAYMSPEQHAGEAADARSDQFGFCVSLYEGLHGERPFAGRTLAEISTAVRHRAVRPRPAGTRVPAALRRLLLRGLALEPERRHPSLEALIADLEAVRRPRRRGWIAVAAALALAAVAFFLVGRGRPAGPRPGIAVMPLENGAGRAELAWLSSAFPEMLSTELAAGEKLRTVPPATARRLPAGPRAAERLGVRYLVTGSFVPAGDRIRIDLRLEEPGGAGVLASFGETVDEAALVELATRAGERFRARLGVPDLSDEEAGRVRATQPASPEAARLHTQAMERQKVGDKAGARRLLEEAVARDARFARAQADLATVLWSLGEADRARAVAAKARELARALPREEQLVIEADVAYAEGDVPQVIRTFQLLYGFFPDRHDYGVQLLSMLSVADRNAEATELLAKLRAVGPPTSEILELDRVELFVAVDAGDLDRALPLARRLVERGRAEDEPTLVIDALFNLGTALAYRGELAEAARAFTEQVALNRGIDDPQGLATAERMLALARREQGRLGEARDLFAAALELDRKVGNDRNPTAPVVLAEVIGALGSLDEAERLRASADPAATRYTVSHGAVAYLRGDLADALSWTDAAIAELAESPFPLARGFLVRGRVLEAQGDAAAARVSYRRAEELCRQKRYELLLARVQLALAGLDVDEGRPAGERLRAALPILEREHALADLGWAAALAGDAVRARALAPAVEEVQARDLILLRAGADPDPIRERAARSGAVLVEMEARLARARLGREPRAALERDARARGLGRIARLAAAR